MDRKELEHHVLVACEAARRGGAVLQHWRERFAVREKARFDLVTDADLAAQDAIQDYLQLNLPGYDFLGEESRENGLSATPSSRGRWIVDPLDGTTNYVHGIPVYGVSIGFEVGGELLLGIVYDPSSRELFHAAAGQGAWMNGQRLRVSRAASLAEALISVGFPPDPGGQGLALAAWSHLSLHTQSLRRTGSTALNLAYVACGRHDAFWTIQAHPWDAAAGVVLIREAGGQVSRIAGMPYRLDKLDILTSNGPLHPILIAELSPSLGEQ